MSNNLEDLNLEPENLNHLFAQILSKEDLREESNFRLNLFCLFVAFGEILAFPWQIMNP